MEEILLLSLNEEKGNFSFTASAGIDFCLIGGILMELELLNRIQVDKKTLQVINTSSTNAPRFDIALEIIDSSRQLHPPHYWVTKLKSKMKHLHRELLEELVNKGYLYEEETQVLLFFTQTNYPLRDVQAKKDLLDRLNRSLLKGEVPNPRTTCLIGLLSACSLTGKLFDKSDRKQAPKNAKQISKDVILAESVRKAIQAQNSAATITATST